MSTPKDWVDADWEAFRRNVTDASVGAPFGGPVGSPKRKPLTNHVLDIKALIGGLDAEGASEAEVEAIADRIIATVPDAVLVRLKAKL